MLLSSFTTKVAVYALARGFAGTEILVPIGAAMTAFPIFYAVIENDLRRVLAYSLNNQLGFMVVGIGIGTELALNGAVAHAFADILFKGAAVHVDGRGAVPRRHSEGLGARRTLQVDAVDRRLLHRRRGVDLRLPAVQRLRDQVDGHRAPRWRKGYFWTWLVLLFASAGVFHHAGIKIPYFAFFAHDSGKRCQEAPVNMLVAMAIAAALCIGIGSFPALFYYHCCRSRPDFRPYSLDHVVAQVQLLFLSALAFTLLMRTGIYPPELRSINLDCRLVLSPAGPTGPGGPAPSGKSAWALGTRGIGYGLSAIVARLRRHHGPDGLLARPWPAGTMAFWTTVMLAAYLILFYL